MVKDGILGKSWLRANALLDDKKEYDEEKKKSRQVQTETEAGERQLY